MLVEGGAGLAASFLREGLVDRVQAYVAPLLLGAGAGVVDTALAATLADAPRFALSRVTVLGGDVLIEMER